MGSIVLACLLSAIVIAVVLYLRREKKRGAKCIGCPYAKQCGDHGSCGGKPSNKLKQH